MISSPLRYPGGKGRLYGMVKQIMQDGDLLARTYVEPFAGGFGIGIRLLTNNDVTRIIINDADRHIYAFWHCVFFDTIRLVDLIRNTDINLRNWDIQKRIYNANNEDDLLKLGFSAFFLNRTNYSGVLSGGPIGGRKQDGEYTLGCRYNREILAKKVELLGQYQNQVEVYNYDAIDFIERIVYPRVEEMFVNFDPPYVNKGPVLYKNYYSQEDHINLAHHIQQNMANAQWIMTYDDCPLIRELYAEYDIQEINLIHFAGKTKMGKELLINNIQREI